MVENVSPWFITQELDRQVYISGRIEEAQKELAPQVNERVHSLIKKIIPEDPHPTSIDRIQADIASDEVFINFTYGHIDGQQNAHSRPGDEIDVTIHRGKYPRENEGIPEPTTIKVGKKFIYLVNDDKVTLNGRPLNRSEIEGHQFNNLLNSLESGEIISVIMQRDRDPESDTLTEWIPVKF